MTTTTRRTTTDEALAALLDAVRERAADPGHYHIRAPFNCLPTDPQASDCRGMHPAVELARVCGRTQRQARQLLAHRHRWEPFLGASRCADCGQICYRTGESL
jgi:hypothetical protein